MSGRPSANAAHEKRLHPRRKSSPKLRVIVHYLLHHVLDHLLADDAILLARQLGDGLGDRVDDFIGFSVLQRQIERGKHETIIAVAQLRERWG